MHSMHLVNTYAVLLSQYDAYLIAFVFIVFYSVCFPGVFFRSKFLEPVL